MHFLFEQHVSADPEAVFAFFADPQNLAILHAEDRAFRLLRHAHGVLPGMETWVEYRVATALPVVLGFRHEAYDPPRLFSERLVHGPFARFEHRHEFSVAPGGTLVRDVLELRLPRLYGGDPALRFLLAPHVRRRFEMRQRALVRALAARP